MRTTLTLDPDVAALLKKAVARGEVSFKEAVNDALRRGLADVASAKPKKRFVQRVMSRGGPVPSPAEIKRILYEDELERYLRVSGRR